jgi:hypothetical protein
MQFGDLLNGEKKKEQSEEKGKNIKIPKSSGK